MLGMSGNEDSFAGLESAILPSTEYVKSEIAM